MWSTPHLRMRGKLIVGGDSRLIIMRGGVQQEHYYYTLYLSRNYTPGGRENGPRNFGALCAVVRSTAVNTTVSMDNFTLL